MKVLWICHFSNPQIRKNINFNENLSIRIFRKLLKRPKRKTVDYAVWISNAINEFENFKDVDLYIISPQHGMVKRMESFQMKGVNYYFFKPDAEKAYKIIKRHITNKNYSTSEYTGNRKVIKKLVNRINPDVIHMFGAENPFYSISAFDINTKKYPFLVSLQTLMSTPGFKENYFISQNEYQFRSSIEKRVLEHIRYIGSSVEINRQIIWDKINPKAIFFNSFLALEQKVEKIDCYKKYDFVFFAAVITKLSDVAVEAFALAFQKYPSLTLNIIGETPEPFFSNLKFRIKELGIENNVFFSGKLPEHKDVLIQIQMSKYAILPLKVDFISGTIREAIYAGLPVVTTKTHGTPMLNEIRKSVLISDQEDFKGISDNMIKLVETPELCEELKKNALITVNERYSNEKLMYKLKHAYQAIIDHHRNNTSIPVEIGVEKNSK